MTKELPSIPQSLKEDGAGARASLDSRAGRTVTEAEWAVAQKKLLEFVTILRGWAEKTTSGKPGFGNVEGHACENFSSDATKRGERWRT